MLALLLGFLGIAAAAGGGGGGSSKSSVSSSSSSEGTSSSGPTSQDMEDMDTGHDDTTSMSGGDDDDTVHHGTSSDDDTPSSTGMDHDTHSEDDDPEVVIGTGGHDHDEDDHDHDHGDGDIHETNDDVAHDDHDDDHTDDDDHDDHADDEHSDGDDHDDHADDEHVDDDDHHDHDHDSDLPQTAEEIAEFVETVRNGTEQHVHDVGDDKLSEHMALLDLVPPAEATHIAIGNGSWFDPDNWHNGEVPGEGAKVVIPSSVHMEYDGQSDASLFTVRVDGELDFATDMDSKMVVDTLVVSPSGTLTIGTEDMPVEPDVNVDIVIADNGPIDVEWDPTLVSRGVISHGKVEINGHKMDSHEKVIEDPMAGDTSISFDELPEGWAVGDKIVIAGTRYEGYTENNSVYNEPEDEIRFITRIEDGQVFFDDPLIHDHDTPRDDLFTSVANYSRSVTIRTEDPDAEISERGHVMLMHSDDVEVRYAAFEELGRTDKSFLSQEASDFDDIASDSNVAGRYALHLHRLGTDDIDNPAIVEGNAVFGSPGWGYVHHDSNAILDNNASFNTYGAGFVSETGNEIGSWNDNIAIGATGRNWNDPKVQVQDEGLLEFDTGVSGDGFWFQSRMVESTNNVAASVHNGFVYFHRGEIDTDGSGDGQILFDADVFKFPAALYYGEDIRPDDAPIISFKNNEVFAAKDGLYISKSNPNQGHDVHSVLEDFTAWSVQTGAHLEYTSHYVLKNFDLIGNDASESLFSTGAAGIEFASNTSDIIIVDSTLTDFRTGVDLYKDFINIPGAEDSDHEYTLVNLDITTYGREIRNYDEDLDTVLNTSDLGSEEIKLEIDGALKFSAEEDVLRIKGTKTDGLGESDFLGGTDFIRLDGDDMANILENNGYYTTADGVNFTFIDLYFSDRLTGNIYKQTELVELDDDVPLGVGRYAGAVDRGEVEQDALENAAETSLTLVYDTEAPEEHAEMETDEDDLFAALTANQPEMAEHDMDDMDDGMAEGESGTQLM